jgi:hypothetical protein
MSPPSIHRADRFRLTQEHRKEERMYTRTLSGGTALGCAVLAMVGCSDGPPLAPSGPLPSAETASGSAAKPGEPGAASDRMLFQVRLKPQGAAGEGPGVGAAYPLANRGGVVNYEAVRPALSRRQLRRDRTDQLTNRSKMTSTPPATPSADRPVSRATPAAHTRRAPRRRADRQRSQRSSDRVG